MKEEKLVVRYSSQELLIDLCRVLLFDIRTDDKRWQQKKSYAKRMDGLNTEYKQVVQSL